MDFRPLLHGECTDVLLPRIVFDPFVLQSVGKQFVPIARFAVEIIAIVRCVAVESQAPQTVCRQFFVGERNIAGHGKPLPQIAVPIIAFAVADMEVAFAAERDVVVAPLDRNRLIGFAGRRMPQDVVCLPVIRELEFVFGIDAQQVRDNRVERAPLK